MADLLSGLPEPGDLLGWLPEPGQAKKRRPAPVAKPGPPAKADGLRDLAGRIADEQKVPRDLFTSLIQQESNWNPRAVSKAGAQGLGQLMPGTAAGLGVKDPFDPEQNLRGAARYLKQQLNRFGSDPAKALAAYNSGPAAVKKYGGVPPYAETQDYVQRITQSRGGALPARGGGPRDLLSSLPEPGDLLGALPEPGTLKRPTAAPARPAPLPRPREIPPSLRPIARPPMADVNPLSLALIPRGKVTPAAPVPTTTQEVGAAMHSGIPARMVAGIWQTLVKSGHAINAATNEMAFRNRVGGLTPAAIAGIYYGLRGNPERARQEFARSGYDVRGIGHAFTSAFQDAGGSVPMEGFRTATGPNAPKPIQATAAGLDFLFGLKTDPAAAATGGALGLAGKGVTKGVAALAKTPLGQRAVGATTAAAGRLLQTKPVQAGLRTVGKLGVGPLKGAPPEWATRQNGLLQKGIALVKQGYLSGPGTVVSNAVSNLAAGEQELTKRGLSPLLLLRQGKAAKAELAAARQGVTSRDITELGPLLEATQQATNVPAGTFGRFSKLAKNPILEAHGRNEQWSKLTLYKALKAGGVVPQDAAKAVEGALYNYGNRNWLLKMADTNGLLIFNTFPIKSTELFFKTLRDNPNLILRYPNLQRHLQESTYTREQYDKLPADRKGTFVVPLGSTGKFIDLSRWHPLASSVDTARELANAAAEGRAPKLFGGGKSIAPSWAEALNKSIFGTFYQQTAGETQSGRQDFERQIGREGAPPGQRWQDEGWRWARALLPPVRHTTNIVAAARGITPEQIRRGEARPLPEVLSSALAGVNVARPEERAARGKRTAAAMDQRYRVGRRFATAVAQQLKPRQAQPEAGAIKAPVDRLNDTPNREFLAGTDLQQIRSGFAAEAAGLDDLDMVKSKHAAARAYYKQQIMSSGNITTEGRITDKGRQRIAEALLRLESFGKRLDALALAERTQRRTH